MLAGRRGVDQVVQRPLRPAGRAGGLLQVARYRQHAVGQRLDLAAQAVDLPAGAQHLPRKAAADIAATGDQEGSRIGHRKRSGNFLRIRAGTAIAKSTTGQGESSVKAIIAIESLL
ncbi:hypothetical protein D3C84_1040460 [compost metagenome]